MNTTKIKTSISNALKNFSHGTIKDNAIAFFNVLGYDSQKRRDGETPDEFLALLDGQKFHQTNALFNEWQSVSLLFQLTDEEMSASGDFFRVNQKIDNAIIESYLFFAITLQEKSYNRTDLSKITREINKLFHKPVLVLFKHGETLTLAIINRRLHKRDESKDVLEKVTLIKDINFNNPHRAHVEILYDFSLEVLRAQNKRLKINSFVALHQAWEKVLDTSELNKRFFKEIADWYFWAVQLVTFPKEAGDDETRNHISVIRLITRLIFVWFLKERGLIPATLFDKSLLDGILYYKDAKGSTYYKAILQNLFFATLNQEMNTSNKPNNRQFRGKGKNGQRDQNYLVHNVYRYERYFRNAKDAFDVFFANIPFLNGGLFECLDKKIKVNGKETVLRIDGFSERTDNEICVPDILFFTETPQSVDLNVAYGTKNKKYQVQGIINIFNRYKFTIAENTPIEEEIALDPELLGKVFENLLAAYNPETGTTARKQTGSFYTPREIVNYMVDETLIAYLETQLGKDSKNQQLNTQLRTLVGYNEENHGFNEDEVQQLITAIDQIKMLDPACGSGAFPMGGLHKLVSILSKLDPNNARWKEQQIAKAKEIPDSTFRDKAIEDIEQAFSRNELDYGRKLYLIQNGIFGIDIQPIAVQIAKLRFFISLLVDQKINESRENRGVRPLPNLETKFVAANTLIGLEKPKQTLLRNLKIEAKEKELAEVRASYFTARTPKTKNKYRERDQHIRAEISELLLKDGFARDTTERLANWNPYDQNASADFFDAEWMFGVSNGFDVVIGNPPYGVNLSEYEKNLLQEKYPNIPDYESANYFLCKAWEILRENGIKSFIIPNTFTVNIFAEKFRQELLNQWNFIYINNLSGFDVFETAKVRNCVTIFAKVLSKISFQCVFGSFLKDQLSNYKIINKNYLTENINNWLTIFTQDENSASLVERIKNNSQKLADFTVVSQGLIPYDKYRGHSPEIIKKRIWHANHQKDDTYRKELKGRDVKRYSLQWNGENWISYGDWLAAPRKKDFFTTKRILVREITNPNILATYTEEEYYNSPSIINIISFRELHEFYFLAVINSKLLSFYHIQTSPKAKKGLFPKILVKDIRNLPVKKISLQEQQPFITLVDKILTTKRTNPTADTSALEAQIDKLVYQLYGLTEEEIQIVEEQ